MDNWTKTELITLRWIKFNQSVGGSIYIRQDLIEAYNDNLIKTSTGQSYPELVNVIETMEKS